MSTKSLHGPNHADINDLFVDNLREQMSQRRISGSEIARILGVSRQAIANLLAGKNVPSIVRASEVSAAIGKPIFYMLMTEAEQTLWESKQAAADPRNQLHHLIEDVPPSELETVKSLLEGVLNALKREQITGLKKA